jgi:uncharacterized membrane protein YccC
VKLPTLSEWLFSWKTFAAGILALYIALYLDLPRPYWAMATVYITTQPLAGATRSKALYRVMGTAIGAAFSVFITPLLINAPELLTLAVALWIGLCLYLSLLDRTPRSYLFMLSGYTAALIVFPSVGAPETIFDTGFARFQEITLGIICASLVADLVLPQSVGPVVSTRIHAWLQDAGAAAIAVLEGKSEADAETARAIGERSHKLAADAVAIDGLMTQLGFDVASGRGMLAWMMQLRQRMLLLLPLLPSIADRLRALRETGDLPPAVTEILADIAAWIRRGGDAPADEAARLREAIRAASPELGPDANWSEIVRANLMARLTYLVDIRQDCRILQRHVAKDWGRLREPLAYPVDIVSERHVDHGMALLSAASAVVAILALSAAWILTGWPDGGMAATMAAVACSFFAVQDDPAPGIMDFAKWSLVSVVLVGAYSFAILPAINGFSLLALSLAPYFVLVGLLVARPQTGLIGMTLGANGATFMAVQSTFTSDFAGYTNSSLAVIAGMGAAAVLTRLFRSVGVEFTAGRLVRAGRHTVARAAERRGHGDRSRFAAIMLDRLGLMVPRLSALRADGPLAGADLLGDVRVGLNVVDLRAARHRLPAASVAAIDAVLAALSRHYRAPLGRPGSDLLARIDDALRAVMATPDAGLQREALLGLVGIRRGLFPDAPAYRSQPRPEAPALKEAA